MTGLDMVHNSPANITIKAYFDGNIPTGSSDPVPGDDRVSLTFFFGPPGRTSSAYQVYLTGTFGIVAGRVGAGAIDSSGFTDAVNGRVWTLSFNPSVFTQLEAGQHIEIGAKVLVEQYVSNGSQLGWFQLGTQNCPS